MSIEDNSFPKYIMRVNGVSKKYILRDAGLILNDSKLNVDFGDTVVLLDGGTRIMTEDDKSKIRRIAKEYAGYKK